MNSSKMQLQRELQCRMILEWDEAKDTVNRKKHGLYFADAEFVFAGPCVTFEDDRFDMAKKG